jgi:hypothetical protein
MEIPALKIGQFSREQPAIALNITPMGPHSGSSIVDVHPFPQDGRSGLVAAKKTPARGLVAGFRDGRLSGQVWAEPSVDVNLTRRREKRCVPLPEMVNARILNRCCPSATPKTISTEIPGVPLTLMKPEGVKRVRDNIRAKMGAQTQRRESLTGEPRLARGADGVLNLGTGVLGV